MYHYFWSNDTPKGSAIFYWSHRLTLAQCGKEPHLVCILGDSVYWRLGEAQMGEAQRPGRQLDLGSSLNVFWIKEGQSPYDILSVSPFCIPREL